MRTVNFQMFKLDLEKAEEPEIKLPTSVGSSKKQESSGKNIYFCFIDYAKAFDCVDHNKLWKFFKSWEYQTTWPASWEIYVQVKKHQLELDMEQQTGSKLGKECVKADIVTLLIAGWCEELTHLKRPWWWERLKAGGEGDIRG